jgi:hypothetical protein
VREEEKVYVMFIDMLASLPVLEGRCSSSSEGATAGGQQPSLEAGNSSAKRHLHIMVILVHSGREMVAYSGSPKLIVCNGLVS